MTDPRTIISAARYNMARKGHSPYLASIAWSLNFIEKPGIGTMGTDERLNVYYDPEVVSIWGVKQTEAVIIHECHHIIRNHMGRKPSGANHMAWNVAADAEINDDLRKEHLELPTAPFECVFPEQLQMDEWLTAEQYYAGMPQIELVMPTQGSGSDGSAADGEMTVPGCGNSAGNPQDYEDGPKGVGELEKDILRRKVAEDVQGAKQRGEGTGGLDRWADELLHPKIDWRKELRASVKAAMNYFAGVDDYTYRKPNRRRHGGELIFPATVAPVVRTGVVIDTSGSMSTKEITECLAECRGIIEQASGKIPTTVMSVDWSVNMVKDVFSTKDVGELPGGGGTDMQKGVDACEKLKVDVCVVLTDGETGWADAPPQRMKVIVGIVGDYGERLSGPEWAKTIHITRDDD